MTGTVSDKGVKMSNELARMGQPAKDAPDGNDISRALIKAMAEDIGKSLCSYVEVMFPEIWHNSKSGFKISLRNHVYNDIMSIVELHDEAAIRKRLADNSEHRKRWVGAYRKMRRTKREKPTRPMERLGAPKP